MATGNLIPAYVIVLEIKRDMATYVRKIVRRDHQ